MRLFMTRRFGQVTNPLLSNLYSLEPTYDKTQVDIRLFNILYCTSRRKTPPTPHPMVMQIHVYINIKKQILFFFIHLYQQPQLLAVKKKLEPTWNRFPSQVPLPSYRIRKSTALLPIVALPGTAGWSF